MRTAWLPGSLLALCLMGCSDRTEDKKADAELQKAVTGTVCAKDREQMKFALADVAALSSNVPEDVREDTIWNMVDAANCSLPQPQ